MLAVVLLSSWTAWSQEGSSVQFSTYLGGRLRDTVRDVAVDAQGNTYLVGGSASASFPTTTGAYDETFNGDFDVIVAKLDDSGSLVWSTFLGGPNYDRAYAVEVDDQGYVYVAGRAGDGFPTTAGSVQPGFGGDLDPNSLYGPQDGFVAKLTPDGSRIVWSTYFGGDDREVIREIDIDGSGNVYLVTIGFTRYHPPQPAHPHITAGAFQTTPQGTSGCVFAKISADGASVVYASYFGGSGSNGGTPSIRVDGAGHAYLLTHTQSTDAPVTAGAFQTTLGGGIDLSLVKLSRDGSALVYGTYFGGSGVEFTETHGLAVDANGVAYITATTKSADLPVTAGAFQTSYGGSGGSSTGKNTNYPGDGFVAKISADGSTLLAATYLGGSEGEGIEGSAIDADGNVHVSGATYSSDFPVTADAVQGTLAGAADYFVATLGGDLDELLFSTYLGGSNIDYGRNLAIDPQGTAVVGGDTRSADWPTLNALQGTFGGGVTDAGLARIEQITSLPTLGRTAEVILGLLLLVGVSLATRGARRNDAGGRRRLRAAPSPSRAGQANRIHP